MSAAHPQIALVAMHTGVVGCVTQRELFDPEHTRHCPAKLLPVAWHAGIVALGQESWPGFVAA